MSFYKVFAFLLLGSGALLLASCGGEDLETKQAVITTLTYTLTPNGGGDPVILSFRDLDGNGDNAPVITGGILLPYTTYTGTLTLLNELENPVRDVTAEVQAEADKRQFFFAATNTVSIAYNDSDNNGYPLGLSTTISTGIFMPGTSSLTVILRHQPDKDARGVADGDISNAGGETAIEVAFPITI